MVSSAAVSAAASGHSGCWADARWRHESGVQVFSTMPYVAGHSPHTQSDYLSEARDVQLEPANGGSCEQVLGGVNANLSLFANGRDGTFHEASSGFSGNSEFVADFAVAVFASIVQSESLLHRKFGSGFKN